jgi:hypothetical protein
MKDMPLHWSIDTHSISQTPAAFSYEANAQERDALKLFASAEEVTAFRAQVKVAPGAGGRFKVSGRLQASLVQSSVVDLEAVPSTVEQDFNVEYWPAEAIEDAGPDSAPFDADPPEAIVAGKIPIGEFLCELFAVSVEPYPRNPDDTFEWTSPHPEPETSPFATLAQLKPQKPPKEE